MKTGSVNCRMLFRYKTPCNWILFYFEIFCLLLFIVAQGGFVIYLVIGDSHNGRCNPISMEF